MSDPFAAVLPRRKPVADEVLIDEVKAGRSERALARVMNGKASEELYNALLDKLAADYPEPERYLFQYAFNPFSDYFAADSNTGVIHRADVEGDNLITEASPACGGKGAVFNRVMPGRFLNPDHHQSRCRDCDNKENVALAEEEACETVDYTFIVRERLDWAASEKGAQVLSSPDFHAENEQKAEKIYWARQGLEGGKNLLVGILGLDDYDYFARQLDQAPESVIGEDDWVRLFDSQAPIQLRQSLLYLLMERVEDA